VTDLTDLTAALKERLAAVVDIAVVLDALSDAAPPSVALAEALADVGAALRRLERARDRLDDALGQPALPVRPRQGPGGVLELLRARNN
jgi:hypothetical protein